MPIAIGLPCDKCGTLHLFTRMLNQNLISKPAGSTDVFSMSCRSCNRTLCFNKDELKPYNVQALSLARGYARRGHYDLVGQPRTERGSRI